MAHRTQITLTDAQYENLRAEARRTGASLSELVRRAVGSAYGQVHSSDTENALAASFGAWGERDFDGAHYVERLRRGMGRRLAP